MKSTNKLKSTSDQASKGNKGKSIVEAFLNEFMRKTESDKRVELFGSDPLKS